MSTWRTRLGRLWHWLVLLLCLVGAAGAVRLAWAGWTTLGDSAETGGTAVWWGVTALAVMTGVLFLIEAVRRIRTLRRG
jgi:TRAP-type mannitol/chloroaromatic compound transport system permease small subunit